MLAGTLEIEMLANMARLSRDMDEAKRAVGGAMASIESAVNIAKAALGALAVGMPIGAVVAMTKSLIDAADAMNDLSQQVGIAVKDLAKYELATAQSGTSMEALAKGIKGLSGNLVEHGDALRKAGITATDADSAMLQLADVFAEMPDGIEKTTLAVKLFGKSGMELIPMLNLGSKGLADAAEKSSAYAQQMAAMAPQADAFNDNLAVLGMLAKTTATQIVANMLPAMVTVTTAMAEAAKTSGILGVAWEGMSVIGGRVIDKLNTKFLEFNAWIDESNAKLMRFFGQDAEADKLMNAANERYLKIQKIWGAYGAQSTLTSPVVDTKSTDDALAQYKKLMAALKDKDSAEKASAKLAKERADAEKKAIEEATKAAQTLANIRSKEADEIDAYMRQESNRLADTARASEDAVRAAQAEYDNHGKLQSEIEQTTLARLQDQLVNKTAGTEAYESLQRQIESHKQLIGILQRSEVRAAAETAAKDLADANKKAAEESGRYWEDALMRAFESGKGFFYSLWSTIKNTLQTQVLKVLVTGTLTGVSALADAATGGLSSSLLGSAGGSLLGSAAAGGAGTVSSLLMSPGMGALDIGGFALAGPAGLALAAAAAVAAIFGNKKTPSAGTGEGNVTFDASGAPISASSRYSGAWGLTDTVQATLSSLYSDYAKAARALGISTVQAEFGFGGNTGKEGKDPQFALGVNAGGVSYSSGEIKLTDANVQLAASRAVFAALQGSDLPEYLKGAFDDLMPSTATQEQIDATLSQAASVKVFHEAVQKLPFESLKNLGFDATMALGDASGGLDVLVNALADVTNASANARAGIQALVDGIDIKVSNTIFDMQYGMEDNPGKYNMLNVRATRLNDEMQASTDINAIAAMAEDQIALINQAWGLLSDEQQKAKYLEFEDRLEKIDDYVTTRGADALSLQQAADDKTAATIAAAVEAAVEKALASSAAAMQAVADKTEKPIEVTSNVNLTVTAPVGSEVAINA